MAGNGLTDELASAMMQSPKRHCAMCSDVHSFLPSAPLTHHNKHQPIVAIVKSVRNETERGIQCVPAGRPVARAAPGHAHAAALLQHHGAGLRVHHVGHAPQVALQSNE